MSLVIDEKEIESLPTTLAPGQSTTGIVYQHDYVKFPKTVFVVSCLCD
jgi:hypothetical protein